MIRWFKNFQIIYRTKKWDHRFNSWGMLFETLPIYSPSPRWRSFSAPLITLPVSRTASLSLSTSPFPSPSVPTLNNRPANHTQHQETSAALPSSQAAALHRQTAGKNTFLPLPLPQGLCTAVSPAWNAPHLAFGIAAWVPPLPCQLIQELTNVVKGPI